MGWFNFFKNRKIKGHGSSLTMPDHTYLLSDLERSSVHVSLNQVDTVIANGFNPAFYAVSVLLLLLLSLNPLGLREQFFPDKYYYLLVVLCALYLLLYTGRYWYFKKLKTTLLGDPAPIIVEAHAVVLIDLKPNGKECKPKLAAVVFKESGTNNPRFFTTALSSDLTPTLNLGQIGRVFIDRRRPALYTIDDGSAYQLQQVKAKKLRASQVKEFDPT